MTPRLAAIALGSLCLISASCDRREKQRRENEALSDLAASKNEMIGSAQMTDEGLVVDMEKVKKSQQTLIESGEKMGGKLGEAMKIVAELQKGLLEAADKCTKASDEAVVSFDLKSLSKSRDYDGAIRKFETLILANKDTLEALKAFRPTLTKKLDQIGFTGDDRKGFDQGLDDNLAKSIQLSEVIRNADIKTGEIGIMIMKGLQKGDAHWTWDEPTDQAAFETDEQVDWYNKHIVKLQELGQTQMKAQEELLRHMKSL